MARLHIEGFAGLMPEVQPRMLPKSHAQIAHNCMLVDGYIRPYAHWQLYSSMYTDKYPVRSIAYDYEGKTATAYRALDAVVLHGTPFAKGVAIGGGDGAEWWSPTGIAYEPTGGQGEEAGYDSESAGIPSPTISQFSYSIAYTRSYDSDKPVNRIYGVSGVVKRFGITMEGPMRVLPDQEATDILYEGDLVSLNFYASAGNTDLTHVRLYRTISGLDTGETLSNELDTSWHLVAELPQDGYTKNYTDGEAVTALPLDVYHAAEFQPVAFNVGFFGLTESGWFVAANSKGQIAVSERYLYHAWPVRNYANIPETITDAVVVDDNAYIGTEQRPYIAAVAYADSAMQLSLKPFAEYLPCIPGTMSVAPGGAIYASAQGLVMLSREGVQVVTRETLNAGTVIAAFDRDAPGDDQWSDPVVRPWQVAVHKTTYGAYHNGYYFGFCDYVSTAQAAPAS